MDTFDSVCLGVIPAPQGDNLFRGLDNWPGQIRLACSL